MGKINKKYLNNDNLDLKSLISDDEKILWQGKPNPKSYFWAKFFSMFKIVVIWLVFDLTFLELIIGFNAFSQMPLFVSIFIVIFFILHLTPVWLWIARLIRSKKDCENIEYIITSKRILSKTKQNGVSVDSIYYKDIKEVNLNITWLDRRYKVGDIYITSQTKVLVLEDISSPFETISLIQNITNKLNTEVKLN